MAIINNITIKFYIIITLIKSQSRVFVDSSKLFWYNFSIELK